jgi:CHAD domain-containing protein
VNVEREVKLAAWGGFAMPPLDGIVEGVVSRPIAERRLDATYHDTADLRLARSGVSLRHRAGDSRPWTVKLPEGDSGAIMVRREISFDGSAADMPAAARSLVTAYVRSSTLTPVARLRTVRKGVELVVGDVVVAEVVDDEVSVYHGRRLASRFRELEVEVMPEAPPDLLPAVVRVLRSAGASATEALSKVARALGPCAQAAPDLVPVALSPDTDIAGAVRAAVTAAAQRIIAHDPGVRMGDDPEDVHQARVGTRRLRSDLRTFGPLLDREWVAGLRAEAGWYAGLLGVVRDAEVLAERLGRQASTLSPEDASRVKRTLVRRLATDRRKGREAVLAAMDGERYAAFLESLIEAAADPRFAELNGEGPAGSRRAADAIPALVRAPWRRLRRAVEALDPIPPDEALHEVRILAKHTRYAAEAAAPVMGKQASTFAAAVARLQTVLGDHQDACFAEAWLSRHVARAKPPEAFLLGQLVGIQRAEAAACRARWRSVWNEVANPKLRAWLR